MVSEKSQAIERRGRNSDAPHRGGATRSSDEAAVMAAEQRGCLVSLEVHEVNCKYVEGTEWKTASRSKSTSAQ